MSERLPTEWYRYYAKHRTATIAATSGLLYAGGWSIGYFAGLDTASVAILILAAVVGGYDIARQGYHEVRNRTLGIKTLVTLAAIGAIAIGAYWEAAAVVFLFSLGSYLEGRTMRKTRTALQELLEMTPDTATVRRDGELKEVPAREVETGETVVVKPGEKLPVDGEVRTGESAVNQAPVTGESAPVYKTDGDEVYAGTINQAGSLEVRTTGAGSDTTLQRIIRRVEQAQEAQSSTERLIDRFAKYYTPGVIALSIVAFAVTRNAMLSLTLLVIGCPGALVIGPPVSVVSAIGNAARNGVLMKGGEHLETAGTIDLVAFDKTGTLTRGEPTVADVEGFGVEDREALTLAAVAEKKSEHHLADAIVEAAHERPAAVADGGTVAVEETASPPGESYSIPDPDEFDVVAGKGVVARHDGREIVVGNRTLLDDCDVEVPADVEEHVREREQHGETAVLVADDAAVVGVVAIRDELREAAPGVIESLRAAGVETAMLTGDNKRVATAAAEAVGIDDYRAELLPEDKQAIVEELGEDHTVAMVGDGINDAPSLATADVGIAMGAAGTDTAIETADMALMADDLGHIPYAVTLSKATRRNVYENVAIAIATVALLLAGVLTSYVTLASGMLVHEASVLAVIGNGMRLLRY
ncbi:cation-translocating P-type ATPase [Halobacteria archaeon HArc-curdl5-1]|uniref:Cation-translocating P-type ATPase n=1 Tax=Halapricum hydrolyticum TaxID=2979991 RepID=A0AAE3I8W1_9EURY|nr:cation-translocating P-type ATPase [Halapricum hydrolyticum]MCU4725452.1 cation-translocating P-type ATPase [Halapricum hydrolyticum]